MQPLAQSYEYCSELTRQTAHNFRFSFMTLPADKRRSMDALYAFNRVTDDLGDEEGVPLDLRKTRLASWRESLRIALGCGPNLSDSKNPDTAEVGTFWDHPAQPAIADMAQRHKIPSEYLFAVIDGVEMDLHGVEMQTFADLERYCYHVAGAVGLCCIHVWGFRGDEAIPLAIDCGLALQLTNILRDIDEDARLGRIYLPREDLERFGYGEEDIRNHVVDERFFRLMQFETERTKAYYSRAERLFQHLEPPGRRILRAMLDIYGGLLREIECRNFDIYSKRVSIPKWKKLWYAGRAMLLTR
jgi:15-cis-phytoene synthase